MTVLEIKAAVRARDGHRCTECGMTNAEYRLRSGVDLDVHRLEPGSVYTIEGCVTLCRQCHGPKPRRPRKSGSLATVKIESEIFHHVKILARARGVRMATYIEELIRPRIQVDFWKAVHHIETGLWPPDAAAE